MIDNKITCHIISLRALNVQELYYSINQKPQSFSPSVKFSGNVLHLDDSAGQAAQALRGEDREAGEQRSDGDRGSSQKSKVTFYFKQDKKVPTKLR